MRDLVYIAVAVSSFFKETMMKTTLEFSALQMERTVSTG